MPRLCSRQRTQSSASSSAAVSMRSATSIETSHDSSSPRRTSSCGVRGCLALSGHPRIRDRRRASGCVSACNGASGTAILAACEPLALALLSRSGLGVTRRTVGSRPAAIVPRLSLGPRSARCPGNGAVAVRMIMLASPGAAGSLADPTTATRHLDLRPPLHFRVERPTSDQNGSPSALARLA